MTVCGDDFPAFATFDACHPRPFRDGVPAHEPVKFCAERNQPTTAPPVLPATVFLRRLSSRWRCGRCFPGGAAVGQPGRLFPADGLLRPRVGCGSSTGCSTTASRPNFKIFGMLCAAHLFRRQLLFPGVPPGVGRLEQLRDGRVPHLPARRVRAAAFHARQREHPAAGNDGLHGVRPDVRAVAFRFHQQDHLPRSPRPNGGHDGDSITCCYLIAVSKFSDMGAYLTGSVIGKQDGAAHQPEQNVGRLRRRAGVFAARQLTGCAR